MNSPPAKRRRGKPKGRHPYKRLSAPFVRSAPPGRHCDGNGLYLYVQKSGTRSWIQRLVIRGRKRELGLGSVELVSLAEAREQALTNRKLARAGGDPLAEKRRLGGIPTFAEAARRVVEQKRAGWRSAAHARNWFRTLEIHAFPRIGDVAVSEVTSGDVLEILTPIWHTKGPTARFVHMRVRAVLEWAIAMDWRTDNPCNRLLPVLGPQHDVVQHHRALPHRDVAAAIEPVRAGDRGKVDTLAFEFMVLTAARGAEVRGAVWSEMDQDSGVWTIPASRMKTGREQRVPLCGRALEILEAAKKLRGGENPVVFVNERGRPLDGKRMNRLLRKHGIAAVPHGFRSSFRDWAAEETDHPREVVEAALAHVVKNKVEAAYRRTDLFERRRHLMDAWSAYLAGERRDPGAGPAP
ncbi:tyrosine-type recombinase/integrase [Candidatus Palauibacter sp.]|uniref:tyrosine-type recombinase/integrase n=1 Tax=Candidatus Palauibacter sp. TaxID=3101350 RepID=UPI003B5160F9